MNWWYIDGSRRLISSRRQPRRDVEEHPAVFGESRPAFTSELIARATSSRGSRSGVRRAESLSLSHWSASSSDSAYWPLKTGGM